MIPNIGPVELGIVILIALVVFGPKRLPELGKSAGRGIKEFRQSVGGSSEQTPELVEGSAAEPDRKADRVVTATDA
jgi:sec-independent protein translocase protein TatA